MRNVGIGSKFLGSADTVLTHEELRELEQKLRTKVNGCSSFIDHVSEENGFSSGDFLYLIESLQEKHIEQLLLLQRIRTWVNLQPSWAEPSCPQLLEEVC